MCTPVKRQQRGTDGERSTQGGMCLLGARRWTHRGRETKVNEKRPREKNVEINVGREVTKSDVAGQKDTPREIQETGK